MSDAPPALPPVDPPRRPLGLRVAGGLAHHFSLLSWWKRFLLTVAVVMAVSGAAGSVRGTLQSKPADVRDAQVTVEALQTTAQRSSLTGEQTQQLEQAKQKVAAVRHWFYDQTAPQLWRVGAGFFVAFVLGYAFRQFVKTMASVSALVLVLGGVAAYFGLINFADVKSHLASGTGWAMERLDGVKATVLNLAGASLSGTAGFVIGFMRR